MANAQAKTKTTVIRIAQFIDPCCDRSHVVIMSTLYYHLYKCQILCHQEQMSSTCVRLNYSNVSLVCNRVCRNDSLLSNITYLSAIQSFITVTFDSICELWDNSYDIVFWNINKNLHWLWWKIIFIVYHTYRVYHTYISYTVHLQFSSQVDNIGVRER